MAKLRGGMEFQHGRPIHLPSPPKVLPAQPIRLTCSVRPEVAVGQPVQPGQVLTAPTDPALACTVCPVDGKIKQIDAWNDGRRYDVTIDPSGRTITTTLPTETPRTRTLENWYTALRRLGPWLDGPEHLSLIRQLAAAQHRRPDTLICIGLDTFPPYPDSSSLLLSFPDDTVLGTQILADVVGAENVIMLAPASAVVTGRVRSSCKNFRMPLAVVRNVYPSADPTMVAWLHTPGRRYLHRSANPVDQRVVLIRPWTAIRLARWFTQRELDLSRPMMLAWPEPGAPLTPTYALAGQPLASLHGTLGGSAAALAGRVVAGNPMTGRPIVTPPSDDQGLDPVVPADELLLSVLGTAAAHKPEPCIHCGWCAQVCPTQLQPIHLAELCHTTTTRHDAHLKRHLPWCIDCGLCSHVCPSNLPLAQTLRAAAQQLEITSPPEAAAK